MSTVHGTKAFGLAEHWCDFSLLSLEEPSPTHLGWLFGFVSLWRFPLALSCACVCGVLDLCRHLDCMVPPGTEQPDADRGLRDEHCAWQKKPSG